MKIGYIIVAVGALALLIIWSTFRLERDIERAKFVSAQTQPTLYWEPSGMAVEKVINDANRGSRDNWKGAHDRNGMPIASDAAKKQTAKHCPSANPLYVEQHGCPK